MLICYAMKKIIRKIADFIKKRPLVSFFSLLGVLLIIILFGNFLRQPKDTSVSQIPSVKNVEVYSIGTNPTVQVSAKIEKSGVISLLAQSPGVVQVIHKQQGDKINRGEWLFSLSTNYQGGNIQSASREIAQKNFTFVEESFETQKQMISKRRDIANATDTSQDELRDLTSKSIDETKNLISLNEEILSFYDDQIKTLEASGADDSIIIPVKQTKSGILSGLNSLRSALRNNEYQTSGDQEPAKIANISRELTNQQLDLEEKSLSLNREISKLNLRIAQISESLMYPASPITGIIERIYVNKGDLVNPGTRLATITGTNQTVNAVALVSPDMAGSISRLDKSTIKTDDENIELFPTHISTEPTDGQLHSIIFTLPESDSELFSNGSFVVIEIPISKPKSVASVPFIPLDAVYQTQAASYIFIAVPDKKGTYVVESRTVILGDVVGSYVEVKKGLHEADQVIINRDVIAGDIVRLQ